MATFFTLQDGSLTDASIYGYSLSSAEITNNTTGFMVLTSGNNLYSASVNSDGSTLNAVALHLSSRNVSASGTLGISLRKTANPNSFLDNSSNNLTITTIGSGSQNTFSPFSPNGWSAYFNGSTDYLSYPIINMAFGSASFTIEGWIYPLDITNREILSICSGTAAASTQFVLARNSSGQLYLNLNNGTNGYTVPASSATQLSVGAWTHFAIVRNLSTASLYINGVSAAGLRDTNITSINSISAATFKLGTALTTYFYGYLSNIRVLSGISAYTTTSFTPSTSPLTNINNTSLLTLQDNRFRDNSNYNLTLTSVNGSVAVKDINPFTPVSFDPSIHGGSGYFTGSNVISIASTPSLTFGTGDFTVEFWLYPLSSMPNGTKLFTGGTNNSFTIETQATDNKLWITNYSGQILATNTPILSNQWNHFAASRSSGKLLLYVNGVSAGQLSSNATDFTQPLYIGGNASSQYFTGYISNLRVLKGTGLYTTATITPSTSPLTNITGTVLLLNTNNIINSVQTYPTENYTISSFTNCDGSNNLLTPYPQNWQILKLTNPLSTNRGDIINYTLSSSNPNEISLIGTSITATDITGMSLISSTNSPSLTSNSPSFINEYSYNFNGTSNFYFSQSSNPQLAFGLRDFTIECWVYPTAFSGTKTIYATRVNNSDTSTNAFSFSYDATGKLYLYSGSNVIPIASQSLTANTWHHVAVTRYNNLGRIYLNGMAVCSGIVTNNFIASRIGIGSNVTGGAEYCQGVISNLRVINGTALYNTLSFTPPTASLNIIPNTVLLLKNGVIYDQALITSNVNQLSSNFYSADGVNPYLMSIVKTPLTINGVVSASNDSPFINGTGSYFISGGNLTIPFASSQINLARSFTIEYFIKPTNLSNSFFLLKNAPNTTSLKNYRFFYDSSLSAIRYSGENNYGQSQTYTRTWTSSSLILNQWNHIVWCRVNSVWNLYVNGSLKAYTDQIAQEGVDTSITINTGNSNPFSICDGLTGYTTGIRMLDGDVLYNGAIITKPNRIPYPSINTQFYLMEPYSGNYIQNSSSIPLNVHIGNGLESNSSTAGYRNVSLNSNSVIDNLFIHNNSYLNFNTTTNLTLAIKGSSGIQITSNGTLNIGSSSSVVPLSSTHTIILSNTQIDVHNGGNLNVYGYPKTISTYLSSDVAGGNYLFSTTNSAVSSIWLSGDSLLFTPNTATKTSFDLLTLNGFTSANQLSTTSNSVNLHYGLSSLPYIPSVFNLTRNVIIKGFTPTTRGTIRTVDAGNMYINYTQLDNFGINTTNKNGLVVANNLSGSVSIIGSSIISDSTTNNISFNSYLNNVVYFDGASYLTINALSTLDFGTNNFTIETWINPLGTGIRTFFSKELGIGNPDVMTISVDASNKIALNVTSLSSVYNMVNLVGPTVLTNNTWYHVAVTRNSNIFTIYLNGKYETSATSVSSIFYTPNSVVSIGCRVSTAYSYFNGYMSNYRILTGASIYNSSFIPSPLSAITGTVFLGLQNNYSIDNSGNNYVITQVGSPVYSKWFGPYQSCNNVTLNNNIFYKPISGFILNYATISNTNINNNYILNSNQLGLQISNSIGSISMDGNVTMGSLTYGTYLYNNSLTGTYGALNYNSALQGLLLSSNYIGTIVGGGLYSTKEGVYVDALSSNLSGLSFRNIIANNNTSVGFKVSGNSLSSYISPIKLSINGLTASNNTNGGLEAYNITGNLTSLVLNNNSIFTLKTNIGNGSTVIDGVSSNFNGVSINILSALNYDQLVIKNAYLSSLTSPATAISINIDKIEEFRLENARLSASVPFLLSSFRPKLEGSYSFHNCNSNIYGLSSIALTGYQNDVFKETGLVVMRENNLSGNHYKYLAAGSVSLDKTTVKSPNTVSEKLTPWSSTTKLRSTSKLIPVNSGDALTVSVTLQRSAGYSGTAPRLILASNPSLGYSEKVLATSTQTSGWETITGSLTPASDVGVFEVYVDCSGNVGSGYINIDSWNFY